MTTQVFSSSKYSYILDISDKYIYTTGSEVYMSNKKKIQELVKKHPKHFSQMIKRSPELMECIDRCEGNTIAEKVYRLLNPQDESICKYGNGKKFYSMTDGYRYCGKSSLCQCAKESVSFKVSLSKNSYSKDKKEEIQEKAKQTLLQKYGVTNAGQTPHARKNHKAVYENPARVEKISQKVANTKKSKYGHSSYNNRSKAKETCNIKYGIDNPMQNADIAKKSANKRKSMYDPTAIRESNYKRITEGIQKNFNLEVLTPMEDYVGVASRPEWHFRCCDCGHTFNKRFDYASLPRCLVCHPSPTYYKSKQELQLLDFVKSAYDGNVISGDRQIINPFEVDIFLPEKKLAIEYCGLYWHSENSSGKGRLYHRKKLDMLMEQDVQLITVFSDEYEEKKDIVHRMISNKIGCDDRIVLNARQCTSCLVSKEEAKSFHDQHHIQGYAKNSKLHLALEYENKCVMMMSFKNIKNKQWELVRMSSSDRVRGGASKLFTYFIKNYNPVSVLTFADLRWSQGKVYENMGFSLDGNVPPMQSYVIDYQKRVSKRALSKSKLVENGHDATLSEWQILQSVNIDRIWDCGKKRFVWKPRS